MKYLLFAAVALESALSLADVKTVPSVRDEFMMGTKPPVAPVVLSNGAERVEVALTGARILSWRDAKGREVFFMPQKPTSDGAEWSHGGLPLCWPWFGRRDGVIHGFIRTKRFSVVSRTSDALRLRYSLAAGEESAFPHAADLDVSISLTDGLRVVLRTVNRGDRPFDFTCGVHPYFAVGDYAKVRFDGVDKSPFDCTDGMDKAFPRTADGCFGFTDAALGRTVSMQAVGNSHVIVWTPGTVEPNNRNLLPEEMTKFIGYGPAATKAAGPVTLSPGGSHELRLSLSAVAH